ncbi:MAG: TMEM165/GDT1 family protein [Sulfuricellaceae bacterium]|nr:TMEM165/GDT1 family protein [Sulfuricellaceae bacterium]
MEWKLFATVFATVFLAEMADKTQLATLLFAAAGHSKWTVFLGASLALVAASALGVLAGAALSRWLDAAYLKWVAGGLFIAVGLWTLVRG